MTVVILSFPWLKFQTGTLPERREGVCNFFTNGGAAYAHLEGVLPKYSNASCPQLAAGCARKPFKFIALSLRSQTLRFGTNRAPELLTNPRTDVDEFIEAIE